MKAFLIGAYAFVMLAGVMFLGGKVEGHFFPVVGDVHIVRVDPVGETRSRIWGDFIKLRECQFERIEFRLGSPGNATLADHDLEEGAKIRVPGREAFGPWVVQLTDDQLAKRSYSVVFHRCYFFGIPRPWLTETRFHSQPD